MAKLPENDKITINRYSSIITLNVNGLNSPFKKYRTVGWIKKKDLTIHCLQEIHFRFKNTCRFKF